MQVFVPTFLFCLFTQWLGLYVASFLLIAGFMWMVGRIAPWKSLLTSFLFTDRPCSSPSRSRSTSSCRRGRSKPCLGTRPTRWKLSTLLAARLRGPADLEDDRADDGRPGARHFRRRAAGPRRAERRRHPAAAHLHHGPDLGHRDAVLHLLGRAVRRRHHLDPVQHSGRSLVGGHHLRRLSDGAAGQGGRSADRGVHLVVHRLAGRGAADHLPGAAASRPSR